MMGGLMPQLRGILRRLSRAPVFTAVTLVILAVGIGATTAIFSVVNGILLRPLPYSASGATPRCKIYGPRAPDGRYNHTAGSLLHLSGTESRVRGYRAL